VLCCETAPQVSQPGTSPSGHSVIPAAEEPVELGVQFIVALVARLVPTSRAALRTTWFRSARMRAGPRTSRRGRGATVRLMAAHRAWKLGALSVGLVAAIAATPGPVHAREPVSTAPRAQCIATGQVCTKVAGHTLNRLTLVFLTRRVRKTSYRLCVQTPRYEGNTGSSSPRRRRRVAPGASGAFRCRSFRLRPRSRDVAKFDRVENGFRSRVPYTKPHPFPYTGPGRYSACWNWGVTPPYTCQGALTTAPYLTRMVFWIKRDGRVIVRRH
jgi:hypothetical protein